MKFLKLTFNSKRVLYEYEKVLKKKIGNSSLVENLLNMIFTNQILNLSYVFVTFKILNLVDG